MGQSLSTDYRSIARGNIFGLVRVSLIACATVFSSIQGLYGAFFMACPRTAALQDTPSERDYGTVADCTVDVE